MNSFFFLFCGKLAIQTCFHLATVLIGPFEFTIIFLYIIFFEKCRNKDKLKLIVNPTHLVNYVSRHSDV